MKTTVGLNGYHTFLFASGNMAHKHTRHAARQKDRYYKMIENTKNTCNTRIHNKTHKLQHLKD